VFSTRYQSSQEEAIVAGSADAIYARALTLLDEEGLAGISARRLAAELHCSTKTLYQQVGTQDRLIRELVARHSPRPIPGRKVRCVGAARCAGPCWPIPTCRD
jgi:hypothetical protein